MNGLDWILVGIGFICVSRGIWRGAVSQVFGILGVLGGFILACHFYGDVARQLSHAFPKLSEITASAISFSLLFLLTWFIIGVIGFWIAKFLRWTGLGFLDRVLGGVVGLGKALLLAAVLISVLTLFLSPRDRLLAQSALRPFVQEVARYVTAATPPGVQALLEEKRRQLEQYWSEQTPDRKRGPHPSDKKKRERIHDREGKSPLGQSS